MKKQLIPILFAFVILVITALACQLPFGLSGAQPTATKAVAETAIPSFQTATQGINIPAGQPPALVETRPVAGSVIGLAEHLMLYFSQPMDRETVEENLRTEPFVEWSLNWQDDSTLELAPAQSLPLSTQINLTLDTGAQAANGLGFSQPETVQFRTVDSLRVTERLPRPGDNEVNPSAVLMVSFNQPVVSLDAEQSNRAPAFSLDPQANGYGEWLNTSTYIFYPDLSLAGGRQYTLTVDPQLTSLSGAPLLADEDHPSQWTFTTTLPRLVTVEPVLQGYLPIDTAFTLKFNQPMDPASVENAFSIRDYSDGNVPGEFSWNETQTDLTFQPDELLLRNTLYAMQITRVAHASGGTPLPEGYSYTFLTIGELNLVKTEPSLSLPLEIYGGYSSFRLIFNTPLEKQELKSLVEIQPGLGDQSIMMSGDHSIIVSGYFSPNTGYTLKVSADLRDQWGSTLREPYTTTFITSPSMPQLSIPMAQYSNSLFVTLEDRSIPAFATNLDGIDMQTAKLSLSDFISLSDSWQALQEYHPAAAVSWRQDLSLPADRATQIDVPLRQNGTSLPSGLYYLEASASEIKSPPEPQLIVASNVHITMKRSANRLFIWAVEIQSGKPLADALMTVHMSNAENLLNCVTDMDGICQVDLPRDGEVYEGLFVVTGEPGQADFGLAASSWSQGVTGWSFGLSTSITKDTLMAYMYTDRPIYRAGQTVNFRAVVRDEQNGRYTLADLDQIHLQLYGPTDPTTGETSVEQEIPTDLSAYGSGSGSFVLPDDTPPGSYSLRIQEVDRAWLNFQVAEYRKPEIDLQAEFSQGDWIKGEDLQAIVQGQYYFGSSAGNLPVHWALYTRPDYTSLPYGYQVGRKDLSWYNTDYWYYFSNPLGVYVTEGDAKLDSEGSLQVSIPYDQMEERLLADQAQSVTLEVTIKDESEIPTSIRATATIHPDQFYIGIRPEQWSVSAGKELGFAVQTVDWDQNIWADQPLEARFLKISWVKEEPAVATEPAKYVPEYTQVSSANFSTNVEGQARLVFTPDEPGMYLLEVKGANALSQVLSWVGGAGSVSWPNLPDQKLAVTADAQEYEAGQTADIFIPNPFGSEVTALVTVERDWVMRSFVLTFDDPQYTFSLPLSEDDAPNVYVSVLLLRAGEQAGPDFRMGYLNLQVKPAPEILQVDLVPDSTRLKPGGEVTFTIQVSDYQGMPVEGEFSLSLVDKALLALAAPNSTDITQAFYGVQYLGITNSLSLAAYARRIPGSTKDGVGGGGGMAEGVPVVREDFKDTAYWNGQIVTGADGKAEITLMLPDNLTTWIAQLRGVTADTRVGEAENELMTSKDLLIRPVVPGFVVAGDHIRLAAVVHNNTDQPLVSEISLQTSGFEFDDENQAMQRISIPAGGQEKVDWWGTIQDADRLELLYTAEAGDLQDAVRPVQEGISVLHYSSLQTFGTSGVLTEEGGKIEQVGLPRTYTPTGGSLSVEMSPSLAALIIDDLQVLKTYPVDVPEALVSRLLPNLATLQALQDLQVPSPSLEEQLTGAVMDAITRISRLQNADGGWGWSQASKSDPYFTSYVLFGLARAQNSGIFVDEDMFKNAQDYLVSTLSTPGMLTQTWQLDRLVFQYYVLQESGAYNKGHWALYDYSDRLNPWSQALLALLLEENASGDAQITSLLDALETSAVRTATGAHWTDRSTEWQNLTSVNFESAVVIYALAKLDPASPLLQQAVRYLVDGRNPAGGWGSSYETAWALLALTETMKGTGEYTASYDFSSSLNDVSIISGAASGADTLTTVSALVPLEDLVPTGTNTLRFNRGAGGGRMYYRAYLDVHKPITSAEAVQRGINIQRSYEKLGDDCSNGVCPSLEQVSLSDAQTPFQVRLTIILPEETHYLVVEDAIPAGTQIVDLQLETTALGQPSPRDQAYDPYDPLSQGWGWWYFTDPQIYSDHIRWMAASIPAGTYQITYKLIPYLAGEYNVLPAHAYQYYFPEVQGSSTGDRFTITP